MPWGAGPYALRATRVSGVGETCQRSLASTRTSSACPAARPTHAWAPHPLGVDNRDLTAELVPRAHLAGANTILRRRVPYSLPQQAAAAVVQQVSSVIIKQVISAAALNLTCRTRERWSPDNQPRGSRRSAMTV